MKVEFTNRAIRDLRKISDYSRLHFGNRVTRGLEARIRDVVSIVAGAPESAPRVEQRPGMRVVLSGGFPFKIFYRSTGDTSRSYISDTPPGAHGTMTSNAN
jgi:plasmid stabilization system protein ParE